MTTLAWAPHVKRLRHRLGFHPWKSLRTNFYAPETDVPVYDEWCAECGAVRERWDDGKYQHYFTLRRAWREKPVIADGIFMRLMQRWIEGVQA